MIFSINDEFVIEPSVDFKSVSGIEDRTDAGHRLANVVPIDIERTALSKVSRQANISFIAIAEVHKHDLAVRLANRETAAGLLPLGEVGRTEYRRLDAAVERFVEMVRASRADPSRPALDIDLAVTRFHVTGRIREFTNSGPLLFRCAKAKPIDILRAWTLHLAANLLEPGSYTTLVAEDGCRHYTPPAEARTLLEDLLEVYWLGLRAPLKFFSTTAFAFAEGQRKASGGGRSAALVQAKGLEEARKSWEGNEYRLVPAERDQPAIALCFREADPLDADFISLVERIVSPILYHEVKEEP